MSLLDRGNFDVVVYPTEEWIDPDGNKSIRASATGIPARVLIQPLPQSGTSARRAEQDNEGFESEEVYRLRFRRGEHIDLGIRGLVEWQGQTWTVFGFPLMYATRSYRTTHYDYWIKRT